MYRKITSVLYNTRNLSIKLHVNLTTKDRFKKEVSIHSEYEMSNGDKQIKINSMPFITLEMKDNGEWSKDKSIMITDNNICFILKSMKRIEKAILGDKIFAVTKDGKLKIYREEVQKVSERITSIGFSQSMMIQPAIVYDDNDIPLEGVIICLNSLDNAISLGFDEFESLLYRLDRIDIMSLGHMLLTYHVKYIAENNKMNSNTTKAPPKRNPFVQSQEKVIAKGNIGNDKLFDGLGEG